MAKKKAKWIKRIELWIDQNGLNFIIILLVLFFIVVYFWKQIFITVPAGHSAVLFERFNGGTQDDLIEEGLHIIAPWNEMTVYNTRIQLIQDTVQAQTKNGMATSIIFAMRYVPKRERLPKLHKYVGPDYENKLVIPEAIAEIRDILSQYPPDSLYSVSEAILENELIESIQRDVGDNLILFEDIKILQVITPKNFVDAIESKHVEKQKAQEYEYKLSKENQELERKKLEAQGIAEFERISGVSFLKYRSIQANEALSTSPNAKVIVIGNGDKEVPFILSDNN